MAHPMTLIWQVNWHPVSLIRRFRFRLRKMEQSNGEVVVTESHYVPLRIIKTLEIASGMQPPAANNVNPITFSGMAKV